MTGAPAARLGLRDRGRIADGLAADLVVFDPATVRSLATYEEPRQFPEGIPYVFVNGVAVVDGGEHTGRDAGPRAAAVRLSLRRTILVSIRPGILLGRRGMRLAAVAVRAAAAGDRRSWCTARKLDVQAERRRARSSSVSTNSTAPTSTSSCCRSLIVLVDGADGRARVAARSAARSMPPLPCLRHRHRRGRWLGIAGVHAASPARDRADRLVHRHRRDCCCCSRSGPARRHGPPSAASRC